MDLATKTAVLILLLALAIAVDFICACEGFALSAARFKSAGDPKPRLSRWANYFLRNSKRAASVNFIARASLFSCEASVLCAGAFALLEAAPWWEVALVFALVCAVAAALRYAFLELPAASFADSNPEGVLRAFSPFFAAVYAAVLPLKLLFGKISAKAFGEEKISKALSYDFADVDVKLRAEANEAAALPEYACRIIKNAMALPEISACDVMLPRSQVRFMDADNSLDENILVARQSGYSRYPLCRGSLDDCLGVVNLWDIFVAGPNPDLLKLKREIVRLKENEPLIKVLPKLLKYDLHMALVEDDFGGIIGVITLNDVLSELVGHISEDFGPKDDDGAQIVSLGGGLYKISGLAPLHRVEDFLDVDFGTDAPSTFGGLVTLSLGRFPKEGERIFFKEQRLRVTVDKVGSKRIIDMTARLEDPETKNDTEETENIPQ